MTVPPIWRPEVGRVTAGATSGAVPGGRAGFVVVSFARGI
jgi:hypothetical protein